ncbi:MAG TPA: hypothetical protein VJ890_13660 [Vineibacter sp.]|nr:hypothetical protein [Vineibacter sp.]
MPPVRKRSTFADDPLWPYSDQLPSATARPQESSTRTAPSPEGRAQSMLATALDLRFPDRAPNRAEAMGLRRERSTASAKWGAPSQPADPLEPVQLPPLKPGRDPIDDVARYKSARRANAASKALSLGPVRKAELGSAEVFPAHLREEGSRLYELLTEMSPVAAAQDAVQALNEFQQATRAGDAKGMGLAGAGLALAAAGMVPGAGGAGRRAGKLPMDEASRMARADAMGFRRDLPAAIGVAPRNERVSLSAIHVDGQVFTGQGHVFAVQQAEAKLRKRVDQMTLGPIEEGFVTTSGRYVSRSEADEIARRRHRDKPSLSTPPANASIAATYPGYPGGQGVWGRAVDEVSAQPVEKRRPTTERRGNPPTIGETAIAWPRASNPTEVSAEGLELSKLHELLGKKWAAGHDAVVVRDYIPPGGTEPATVIVTRQVSQWRLPSAKFNPSRKNNWDLTAGLVPVMTVSGIVWVPDDTQAK